MIATSYKEHNRGVIEYYRYIIRVTVTWSYYRQNVMT